MTLLAFLQYILAAIALIGLLGLVAYGLTRWVIYTIVWQPWVKVEAVSRPVLPGSEKAGEVQS